MRLPSRIRVVAIEAKNMYHLGEGLTLPMKKKIPLMVEAAKKELRNLTNDGPGSKNVLRRKRP